MESQQQSSLSGEIFEEYAILSVDELSRLCAVDRTYIVELVEEGVLSVVALDASVVEVDAGAADRSARSR